MRLLNFHAAGATHLGLVDGDSVLDLTAASGGRVEFASVTSWLRGGAAAKGEAERLLRQWRAARVKGRPLTTLEHAPLVARDVRIFCVGLNYADHAAENNLPPPSSPIFFTKLASVVIPHGTPIPLPAVGSLVDYEAEVAFVLGAPASRLTEQESGACIAGYTIMNDVTARDLQRQDQQWFRSKNCNGFGPMGPWLVTADEIADPANLDVALRLNGSTGTPAGIGAKQTPPVFLQPGDRMEIEVESVGILRNSVGTRGDA